MEKIMEVITYQKDENTRVVLSRNLKQKNDQYSVYYTDNQGRLLKVEGKVFRFFGTKRQAMVYMNLAIKQEEEE